MDAASEHTFVAKLRKHPTLGKHELLAPYLVETISNGESLDAHSKDYMIIQAIKSRLVNAKTIRDYMAKLWNELELTVFGKKSEDQELKRKHAADNNEEEQGVNEPGIAWDQKHVAQRYLTSIAHEQI